VTRKDPLNRAAPTQLPARLPTSRGAASPPGSCHGAVTAEFAVALPAVVLLLALLLAGSAAGVTQLRLEEGARAAARALARGDSTADVEEIVRRLAGQTAGSAVAADGEWIGVTVSGPAPGVLGSLLPWTFSARAWARRESARATGIVRVGRTLVHQAAGLNP
jgi:hypothetical protein